MSTPKPARKIARKPARKPARKTAARKPARAAKPTRAPKTRRRARGVQTLPIPRARARGPKRKSRKPKSPEIVPPIVIEDERPSTVVVAPETPAEISDGEQQDARRYMAVVSEIEGTEAFPAQRETPLFTPREQRAEVETYPTDIPIALGAALLAVSAFFPWYKGPTGFAISITGWASGTLAPLLVFLAAGSVVLVALRRGGAAVSLPIEESLAHEAVGWLALVAAVVKSRWRPDVLGIQVTTSYGVWIAIGAAALLVVLAGRMSPRAPLVLRPGWLRTRGGTLGAALLLVVVAGSAAFGVLNEPTIGRARQAQTFPGSVEGRLPDCAKDFPFPEGVKPQSGSDAQCFAQLTSDLSAADLLPAIRAKLKASGYVFTETPAAGGAANFNLTRPRCATLALFPAAKGSAIILVFDRCQPTPTPSPTRT